MPIKFVTFLFTNPLGRLAGAALAILALVASFAAHERSVGAKRQVARQEKTDVKATASAVEAARRAADPAARGVRDPNARP